MAIEQYININGLQVERAKYRYWQTPYGYMFTSGSGEADEARRMGYSELSYKQAQNAKTLPSGYEVSDAFKKAVVNVYSNAVLTPPNLKGQVGADVTSIQNIKDLMAGQNMAANPNYVNVGTVRAPLYVLKGSPAELNLKSPQSAIPATTPTSIAPASVPAPVTPIPTPTPASTVQPVFSYNIQSGDTLSAIAAKNGTTVAALMALNPQITNPNKIYAGQFLNLGGISAAGVPTPAPALIPAPVPAPTPFLLPLPLLNHYLLPLFLLPQLQDNNIKSQVEAI